MKSKILLHQALVSVIVILFIVGCGKTADSKPAMGEDATQAFMEDTEEAEKNPVPKVRIGVDTNNPPLEYKNDQGDLTGFDIELLNLIATKASFEVEWVMVPYNENLEAIKSGDVDMILSGSPMPINIADGILIQNDIYTSTLEIVDLSDSFLVNEAVILTNQGKELHTIKQIGFQLGHYAFSPTEMKAMKDFEFIDFPTIENAASGLSTSQVDALLAPKLQSMYIFGEKYAEYQEIHYGYHTYQMAIKKDAELLPTINATLQSFIDDGSYADLYTKWFNQDVPYIYLSKDQRDDAVLAQAKAILDIGTRASTINADCLAKDYPNCKYQEMQDILTEIQTVKPDRQFNELHAALVEFIVISIPILEDPEDMIVSGSSAMKNLENWREATNKYSSLSQKIKFLYSR